MNLHSTNNIVRKENGTSISHVVFGQESKTCPTDSQNRIVGGGLSIFKINF